MRSTTKETGERVRQVGKAIGGLLASAILGATPALAGVEMVEARSRGETQKLHISRHLQAVIAGWLLAFTLSLDDLVIASFNTGPGATTLPIKIYSAVRLGVSPEINALSTILIAVVSLGVIVASLADKQLAKSRGNHE